MARTTTAAESSANSTERSDPTPVQRRWLLRGLNQPGGKLPLFDADGSRVRERTVRSCIRRGWAEPWLRNPIKPDWLVCKITDSGRAVVAAGRGEP